MFGSESGCGPSAACSAGSMMVSVRSSNSARIGSNSRVASRDPADFITIATRSNKISRLHLYSSRTDEGSESLARKVTAYVAPEMRQCGRCVEVRFFNCDQSGRMVWASWLRSGQDVPTTDWDCKSQPHFALNGSTSALATGISCTASSVSETRTVSPMPSASSEPMPMALLMRPSSPSPASVTPRWIG